MVSEKKIHIIYHANCLDGFTAAWVTRKHLLSETGTDEDIAYHACNYGDMIPKALAHVCDIEALNVYVVDFSFTKTQMEYLNTTHNLVVLDHHKTAIEKLEDLDLKGILDTSRSGAMLAWNYFFPHLEVPELVKYIQDRDLWTWRLEDSKCISEYIQTKEKSWRNWDNLEDDFSYVHKRNEFALIGQSLLVKKDLDMEDLIKNGLHVITLSGHKIPCVNAPKIWSSEIGNKICNYRMAAYEDTIAATYCFTGGRVEVSLRSIGDFDVSQIAAAYGGGGHKNAAGFTISWERLALMLS